MYVHDTNLQCCSEKQFSWRLCCGLVNMIQGSYPNQVGFVVLLLFFLRGTFYVICRADGKLRIYGEYLLIQQLLM